MSAIDVAVIGAGPCGLAVGIAARTRSLSCTLFEQGSVVSSIAQYPTYITFFSTAERLAIGGVPFTIATEKPTRREALAYYRGVTSHFALDVRQYEKVERVERLAPAGAADGARLVVHSRFAGGRRGTRARAVVIATGYFGTPNRLGVPGEVLPHVTHYYREGLEAFQRDALVVGGGNSAVETALDLVRAGARVTVVHAGPTFDRNIKPWVRPDFEGRVHDGMIALRWNTRVTRIAPGVTEVTSPDGDATLPADPVIR